jgi:hypothetical protein
MSAEATGWLVEGAARARSWARGTLAYEVAEGVSFDVTGEAGRQPPGFEKVQQIRFGFGFHRLFAAERRFWK